MVDSNDLPRRSDDFTTEKSLFGTRVPRPVGGKPHIAIIFVVIVIGLALSLLIPSGDPDAERLEKPSIEANPAKPKT